MLEPEPEPAVLGPEPPPPAAPPPAAPPPPHTLADISALRRKDGPFEDLDQRQLCVCCSCQTELERARALRCSRCRLAFYCSRACQKSYHKRHVRWCKEEAAAQARLREEHPTALVCSRSLVWHVRRWDARSKEACPDPRYYLRKTAAKHPAYAALVQRDPARLSPLWSYPRGDGGAQASGYRSADRLACLRALREEGAVRAATTEQLCAAAACLVAPDGTVVVAAQGGDHAGTAGAPAAAVLYSELLARLPPAAATAAGAVSAPERRAEGQGRLSLPALPLPVSGGLATLAAALSVAQAAGCADGEIAALAVRLCDKLAAPGSAATAGTASPAGEQQLQGTAADSSVSSSSSGSTYGEAVEARQLLVVAQAEFRLGSQSATAREAEPHHRRATFYGTAAYHPTRHSSLTTRILHAALHPPAAALSMLRKALANIRRVAHDRLGILLWPMRAAHRCLVFSTCERTALH
jgi:hypothetical protein